MLNKSQISWLLVALVLTAYSHCVFAHATESVVRHQQLQADEHPIDNARATCENESSCLCKGATLAGTAEATAIDLSVVAAVCIDANASVLASLRDQPGRSIANGCDQFLDSGKMLRARLQSFLL